MQCPNCEFQNAPGTQACVRCQSQLDLAAVDFIPPRAARGFGRRTALLRLRGRCRQVADAAAESAARAGRSLHPEVDWTTLFWSVVPGLGHMRAGFRRTGRAILAAWFVLVGLAFLMLGSPMAWLLGGAALGLHCLVFSLLLARPLANLTMPRRIIAGVVVYLALVLVLYGPAIFIGRGATRVVPVNGLLPTETLRNGDVLLGGGRWLRPREWRRGDLVLYRIDPPATPFAGGVVIQAGFGVDRVIGVPGDLVACDDQGLTVNDQPVQRDMMPIGGLRAMPAMSLRVAPGEVAVLPSALRWTTAGPGGRTAAEGAIRAVTRVPEANVLSRIRWRLRPWTRVGAIH